MFTAFGERSLVFNALPGIYLSSRECLEDVNCIPNPNIIGKGLNEFVINYDNQADQALCE